MVSSHMTRCSSISVTDFTIICFVKVESTERAIAEVNGSLVGGVQLKVNQTYPNPLISIGFKSQTYFYISFLCSGVVGPKAACY